MRFVLLVGSVLTLIAGVQLFVFPDDTDVYFAWTISPSLEAAFLGAFYWTAMVLAFLSGRERIWANARIGVAGVLIFVSLTVVATLLHLDRFHLASPNPSARIAAWAWLIAYLVQCPALVVALIRQLRVPGDDPTREARLPVWFRVAASTQSVVMFLAGAALFLAPAEAEPYWPWTLTPLTAQASGAWLAGLGFILAQGVWEDDWVRIRAGLISFAVLGLLQLLALARFAQDVRWDGAPSWLYVLVLASVVIVGAAGSRSASRAPRPTIDATAAAAD